MNLKGFISSSFAQGLNPKNSFFIVWQEEQGVCDYCNVNSNKWLYYEEKCQTNRRY